MPPLLRNSFRRRQYVKSVRVAAALLDGPKTLEEISNRYYVYLILRILIIISILDQRRKLRLYTDPVIYS